MATDMKLKAGDIVRYADGVSALLKLSSPHAGGWHGEHVLGGSQFASDQIFYKLKLANEKDIEFCKEKRPDWFIEIKTNLTFDALRKANFKRKQEAAFPSHDWTLEQWACAMAGEVGEACNIVKKLFRGDTGITKEMLANELADIIIYADLLAHRAGINLGEAVINKFNEVSNKKGAVTKL